MSARKSVFAHLIIVLLLSATAGTAAAQVPFLENTGQLDDAVRYYARLSSGTLFVTGDGALVYSLHARSGETDAAGARWAFRETFSGTTALSPAGSRPSPTRVSLFKGAAVRHGSVDSYERVELGEAYPGIRVTLEAHRNNVEKLIHLSPGADPAQVRVAVDGVAELSLDEHERLVLETGLGEIVFTQPVAYQTIDGRRHSVDASYTVEGSTYGFQLGDYRPDQEVVIDPLLSSTLLGGQNPDPPGNYDDDIVHAMVHTGDSVYVAGATQSPNFPIEMGYDDTIGGNFPDGFVTRMSRDLSTVLASTYIGTEHSDSVRGMAIDDEGRIVIVGDAGYGFPVTEGAYTHSGTTPVGGGFVSKLSADLSELVVSSVPTPSDFPSAVALGNGGIYFGGSTNNPGFPVTPDAYRKDCCPPEGSFHIRPYEGFAGRISSDLTTIEAMTYLNGVAVTGIAVAANGSVYISDGSDEAVTGYLARFDAELTERPAYLSYYPGSESGSSRTYFNDVEVLDDDSVVSVGQTYMYDLPATEGAFDTTCGTDGRCDGVGDLEVPRSDGFIGIYGRDLAEPEALTYLGGSYHESIRDVELGAAGTVVVTGETTSTDFPTSANAADSDCGTDGKCDPSGSFSSPQEDAFVLSLTGDLSRLEYGSYLGGSDEDQPHAVGVDGIGDAFVAGFTRSADFPTTAGAFDRTYDGGTSDAFISRFGEVVPSAAASTPGETCGPGMAQLWVDAYDEATSTLTISYAPGCSTLDNNVYYGRLEEVSSYGYSGEVCDVGMSGTTSFGLPDGSFFFLTVGDDDVVEGSYGTDSSARQRPDSGTCGFVQDLSQPCDQP